MPTFECKQHPGFSSSHVVFSNGRARVTTQAQLDSLKPFMGMITKISDDPPMEDQESEIAQTPEVELVMTNLVLTPEDAEVINAAAAEQEKAVYTGKGWWRWNGKGYREKDLPEEALP